MSKIRGDIRKSTTPAANFATSFASVVATGGKFATGVNDTSGKFVTGTGGKHGALNTSANLKKKFETALMVYSGVWGKWIHEKNQKSKIS